MTLDHAVMMLAGSFVLVGAALAYWVHPAWIWLPALVGLNLIQASITGFCPAAILLKRLGVRPGAAFR